MCIIVIKPKNKKIPDKILLNRCFKNNQDGIGYMYVNNKEVVIRKGFMSFDDFYNNLLSDYKKNNLNKNNLVIHFRKATSGKSKLGCTHPFPITDDYNELHLTNTKTDIGICHNGKITYLNNKFGKYSDTQLYIAEVIKPLIKLDKNAFKYKEIQNSILITTKSKWAILDNKDNLFTIGDFINDNGYMYSNEKYKTSNIGNLLNSIKKIIKSHNING